MNNKSKRKLYTIEVILNSLCIACCSLAAVFNNLSHNYLAMWIHILCVACWTVIATLNSCKLAKLIKEEKEQKNYKY